MYQKLKLYFVIMNRFDVVDACDGAIRQTDVQKCDSNRGPRHRRTLKSIRICELKNKSGTFYGPRCMYDFRLQEHVEVLSSMTVVACTPRRREGSHMIVTSVSRLLLPNIVLQISTNFNN